MKKITNAMSRISDTYIDELKDLEAPKVRRRSFKVILVAATLAVAVFSLSMLAVIGSDPPDVPDIPSGFSGSITQNNSNNGDKPNSSSPFFEDSDEASSQDESSFGESSCPNEDSSRPEQSSPDENSENESSSSSPNINENGADFTAQQVADIFGTVEAGVGTKNYQTLGFKDVSEIKNGKIPTEDLPMLIEKDWDYDYRKRSMGGIAEEALYLDGKTIILPSDVSYDEVYQIALEWLPHCQKVFGFEYGDIKIKGEGGTQGWYQIYYYDASANYPYFNYGAPILSTNSYVLLDIGLNTKSDIITLRTILYKSGNNPFTEGKRYNTITLEEAEEMLYKGYVFGGHYCPLCMQEQALVDFSDYDQVGIEYVQKATYEGFTDEYYPFYAFYKEIEEGKFARTYVPAFRVSGLEEFFEAQESKHNSSGLIPA